MFKFYTKLPTLTKYNKQVLQKQNITQDSPGTILQDFQIILQFIQSDDIEVSKTYNQFSLKYLHQLNSRLSYPIEINLKRPQQKSYPYIHGLYFLLRTSGLSKVIIQGKKSKLVLNQQPLKIWHNLNPTEKYFTLLESWLVWGSSEILDDFTDTHGILFRCLRFWSSLPNKGLKVKNYFQQNKLTYYPQVHNIALLHLFGFLEITPGRPQPAKGWCITAIQATSIGKAIIAILTDIYHQIQPKQQHSKVTLDSYIAFDKLQPHLQTYFPQWQQTLIITKSAFECSLHSSRIKSGIVY